MTRLLRTEFTFVAVLFLGLFAMAARNVTDPDIWWHLKTGQYMVEHHSVPRADPFSYTRAGHAWIAHEWLSELTLYGIYRMAGWGGLIVIFSAVLTAAFFFVFLRCGSALYFAGVATLVSACACAPVWGARPQVLSLFLTSLWLLILERSESNSTLLWWTLPLTLLWVNLHAGFALGLVLSALFLAGQCLEAAMGFSQVNERQMKLAALTLLLDLLLVPLNPNGFHLFSYPVATLRSADMQNYIAEWASPNFHHPEYWPLLLVVLGIFGAVGRSDRRVGPRDRLLLAVSLYAALCSIRLMPLFILIAAPLIARRLGGWPLISKRPPAGFRLIFNGIIVLAMVVFASIHAADVIQRQPQAETSHFPSDAVSFLATHAVPGPIFNHYDWGGYLIWRLYPSTQVFIDGRADIYENGILDQFADTYQFKGDWHQTLQRWAIATVLVPTNSPLATGLRRSPDWIVFYEDAQAIVLTTATRTHSPLLAPHISAMPEDCAPGRGEQVPEGVTLGVQENTPIEHLAGYYD